jgi:PhoH-like ATPase
LKKTYILDTNVIFEDPRILSKLNGKVVVPFKVLEEIDSHKKDKNEIGANARHFTRILNTLMSEGNLLTGARYEDAMVLATPWDGKPEAKLKSLGLVDMPDNRILATALCYKSSILLTHDLAMRLKAASLNQAVESPEDRSASNVEELYSGVSTEDVSDKYIDTLYANGEAPAKGKYEENHFVMLRSENKSALTMNISGTLCKVTTGKSFFGLKSKNVEQSFAMQALLDNDIPLVTLLGKAGTGKTLLCVAAAMEMVVNGGSKLFDKIIVVRPPVAMGKDVGFMPGTLKDKMLVWSGSIIDNFESLISEKSKITLEILIERGQLEIVPPTFMRGRSLKNAIVIVDEAQNLTLHEMKTMLTRIGDDSRLFLTGDLNQIDNEKLDWYSSGLRHAIDAFKDSTLAAHITLTKGERSAFAELAANLL